MAEYCTQSHLATEDYGSACEGIKFTRRFKKYTYWLRQLLNVWDQILLLVWRVIRYPWQKATGRQPTAFGKTLVWDWKVKTDPPQRRSSIQPLMEDLHDEGSSRGSRTPEPYDIRDEGDSSISMPTLQVPPHSHSRSVSPHPPSFSSTDS